MILKAYSKPLYEFYNEYARWLEGESVYEFSPYVGLCANLWDYALYAGYEPSTLSTELHEQFKAAGLDESLPFNRGMSYSRECDTGSTNTNPTRVEWVKNRMRDYEAAYE